MTVRILHGDALEQMRTLADESVHSVCTDPPYEIGFMGRAWDNSGIANSVELWRECLRVLKPGGHLLSFGGSRTYHRMACAIEDAGFEIRDQIMWIYGSGFPKSLDVSKAIDKARDDAAPVRGVGSWLRVRREERGLKQKQVAAFWPSDTGGLTGCVANWELGFNCPKWDQWLDLKRIIGFGDEMDAEVWRLNGRKGTPGEAWDQREIVGVEVGYKAHYGGSEPESRAFNITAPATDSARQWQGWGTALKPAHEPIVVARKPLIGTVAANVLAHGTGAINVDACRVDGAPPSVPQPALRPNGNDSGHALGAGLGRNGEMSSAPLGRWPANVITDGSDEVLAGFPETTSGSGDKHGHKPSSFCASTDWESFRGTSNGGDTGSAARFFYTAKASRDDRNIGCEELAPRITDDGRQTPIDNPYLRGMSERRNHHPTVKPTDLMQYLVRLVTPPGGTVLDPFAGSGSTGLAADREGFDAILIEQDAEYVEIARRRIVGDCPLFAELAA